MAANKTQRSRRRSRAERQEQPTINVGVAQPVLADPIPARVTQTRTALATNVRLAAGTVGLQAMLKRPDVKWPARSGSGALCVITARQCRRSGRCRGTADHWPRRAAARRRLRRGRRGQRSVAAALGGRPRPVSQAVLGRGVLAAWRAEEEAGWPNRKWPCRDAARDGRCCRRPRQLESPETGEGPAPLVEHAVVIVRDRRARSAPGTAEVRHPTPRLTAADGSDK